MRLLEQSREDLRLAIVNAKGSMPDDCFTALDEAAERLIIVAEHSVANAERLLEQLIQARLLLRTRSY